MRFTPVGALTAFHAADEDGYEGSARAQTPFPAHRRTPTGWVGTGRCLACGGAGAFGRSVAGPLLTALSCAALIATTGPRPEVVVWLFLRSSPPVPATAGAINGHVAHLRGSAQGRCSDGSTGVTTAALTLVRSICPFALVLLIPAPVRGIAGRSSVAPSALLTDTRPSPPPSAGASWRRKRCQWRVPDCSHD